MRIGTVLHGALGDVYEQALCFSILKERYANDQLIAFFSTQDRLDAFKNFDLSMFAEIHHWQNIPHADIDRFDQFQIRDPELAEIIFNHLPETELRKFDFQTKWLPWKVLAKHDFKRFPLRLHLNQTGQQNYQTVLAAHSLDDEKLSRSVGFLWRYRSKIDLMVKPTFQVDKQRIIQAKSDLFKRLQEDYGLNLVVAGMNYHAQNNASLQSTREHNGVMLGEITSKFANEKLALDDKHVTYLQGLGYAAELEIIANTRFQLLMPSGFSEPIWMMNGLKSLLVDPPPIYLFKMLKYRMPLFDNTRCRCFHYNFRNFHSSKQVLKELHRRQLL